MSVRRSRWLLALAFLSPSLALAYSFNPSPSEWAGWPMYCKARYVTTNIGGRSPYSRNVTSAQISAAKAQIGNETFEDVHHYCAGMAYLKRAKLEANAHARKVALNHAFGESSYTYQRSPRGSALRAEIAVTLAMVRREMGEFDEAIYLLNSAIEEQPTSAMPYGALAMVYRAQKKLDLALATLEKGDEALKGENADIQYNLGLVNLELGNIDKAVENARRAYERGYPLPGLKNQLVKLGRWENTAAVQ